MIQQRFLCLDDYKNVLRVYKFCSLCDIIAINYSFVVAYYAPDTDRFNFADYQGSSQSVGP